MTWLELKTTIPFRLNRPDLPDDFVEEMALERVDFYGPQLFTPSEQTDNSIVTQPGQYFYRLPAGTQKVTFVRVLYNGTFIPVTIADSYNLILGVDVLQPPFTSAPLTLCRVYGNQIRFFPTPNGQYPIELTMLRTIGAPTDDNDDGNFWVTDGRMLLINATCAQICAEYLDISLPNSPRIMTYRANEAEALEKLMQNLHAMSQPSFLRQYL